MKPPTSLTNTLKSLPAEVLIDLLAQIKTDGVVKFWRPQGQNESGAQTSEFGTGRQWVEVGSAGVVLGVVSGAPLKWAKLTLTGFSEKDQSGGTEVEGVYTAGPPKAAWVLQSNDDSPHTPMFTSPSYLLAGGRLSLTVELHLGTNLHTLPVQLSAVVNPGDRRVDEPVPIDPILDADEPEPTPNPIGEDSVFAAAGLPSLPDFGGLQPIIGIAIRYPRIISAVSSFEHDLVGFLARRADRRHR